MSLKNTTSFSSKDFLWKGVTITESAAKQILHLVKQNSNIQGLKISVKKSGCAGFSYVINLIKKPNDSDLEFIQFGAKFFVSLNAMPFIDGTTIDYVREGLNQIFKFNNPKVQNTCGCGESFSI
ncbi:Fe-S cluster assembly scaffold SufA [Candidatus Pantoea carbekii]|uniref:SufA protein n=1 Tax=Candidatus Pantoea carbekii TaxID=1235990 RepID=U3U835_9GAMM|nr:Fe-S cluster assembly scaffold SufA [Candidatus Pantoea carbekii]BAO00627.1 SufA protein [Candidatus Pantoea carbekii]